MIPILYGCDAPIRALWRWSLAFLPFAVSGAACTSDLHDGPPEAPAGATATRADPVLLSDPAAPPKAAGNPFDGAKLWVDPTSQASARARLLRSTNPAQAGSLERIASQPQAFWLGEWSGKVSQAVDRVMDLARAEGALPVFVAYNVPGRDCGQHSGGGLAGAEEYRRWIRELGAGVGDDPAVIILEPDALGLLDKCLSPEQQSTRLRLMQDAVRALRARPNIAVYVDAGHPRWVEVGEMARRLSQAGVADANGFALNTSNYVGTQENIEYGVRLSERLAGAHFVIDVSRNGAGPAPGNEWCNPPGRRLGVAPTVQGGHPLVDALLWIKRPGESDGECNGGPRAGMFWEAAALELAR